MNTSNSIRRMHNLRTMQSTRKEDSNYLKLFMLDKERTRIRMEHARLTNRLEILNRRLGEIEEFFSEFQETEKRHKSDSKPDSRWNTMHVSY